MGKPSKLSEAFPMRAWRKQAKANLAPPTESFEGKTVLIVGATGLIVSEAIRIISQLKATSLIFGVRNTAKGEILADELRGKHGPGLTITVWELDLLSFDSVKAFAAKANSVSRIDVILMGAAVFIDEKRVTADNWEESKGHDTFTRTHTALILKLKP
jgi:NAD(P)-dependent dehydrogenase (short-subunit alcohol dehydrogenase family)